MRYVMVDLETLGTAPGCQIVSIGAVEFEPRNGELGREFYQVIRMAEQETFGLHTSKSTVDWWDKQSEEAKKIFFDPQAVYIGAALSGFHAWLPDNALVWGNGADFDNAILAAAAHLLSHGPLWKPYNSRCYRTVKNLAPHIQLVRTGQHHNALDDAKSQAHHLMAIVEGTTLTLA